MALADILKAITTEADAQISDLKAAHKARVKELKAAHEKALASTRGHVQQQKEQRLHQMRSRAEGHAKMLTRHALLRRKQELLESLYDAVVDGLLALPKEETEKMLAAFLAQIPEKGTLHPSKAHEAILKKLAGDKFTMGESIAAKGGFRFVGHRQDRDYTFEFLVAEVLRPTTEIEAATKLFGTH